MHRRDLMLAPLLLAPAAAGAQQWPTRPIRLTVPFSAGGGADVMGRLLAARLQAALARNSVGSSAASASTRCASRACTSPRHSRRHSGPNRLSSEASALQC